MKQTVEEAAYDYATNKTKFRKDVLKEVDADTTFHVMLIVWKIFNVVQSGSQSNRLG